MGRELPRYSTQRATVQATRFMFCPLARFLARSMASALLGPLGLGSIVVVRTDQLYDLAEIVGEFRRLLA